MDFDYVVIGAGVVGLAVASELAPYGSVMVLEKESKFGQGISSRNSEVVHAGLYYPPNSLKARLCRSGRQIIAGLGAQGRFSYRPMGKYIVATDAYERSLLEELKANADACGANEVRWAESDELREQEPDVRAYAALFSPQTGVVDSHGLMNYFRVTALDTGVDFGYDAGVVGIRRAAGQSSANSYAALRAPASAGYEITVADGTTLTAKSVVNCAGLYADRVAEMAGIDVVKYRLEQHWSRGVYYGISGKAGMQVRHLVYPVPDRARSSLGVHVCVDVAGGIRFGPTAEYLSQKIEDYAPPRSSVEPVAAAIKRYLPRVRGEDIYPVMIGIRPKLSGPGEPVRDFYIHEESSRGLPRFVNLIGIESPGLTAAPAIARHVRQLLQPGLA